MLKEGKECFYWSQALDGGVRLLRREWNIFKVELYA